MSEYAAYPDYKETGISWLGQIPEHWNVVRVQTRFEIRKRIAGELGFDVFSITQSGLKIKDLESNDGQISMNYSKYQIVNPGDFAMNHMDLLTGWIDIAKTPGVTSPDYRVFSIKSASDTCADYYLHIFQHAYSGKILYGLGQGASQLGRWRLPTDEFNNFLVPFPPLLEQESIADFISRETKKIDLLIQEQKELITLLQEKRQALISNAVTKGLNPKAKMKDSGVEWLGQVPEHWDIKRLRFLIRLNPSKQEIAQYPRDVLVDFLPMDAVGEDGSLKLEAQRKISEVETGYTYFSEGDVTYAKITPCFENGKGALMQGLSNGFGFGTTELTVMRPLAGQIESYFLMFISKTYEFRNLGEAWMYGAGGQKRVPDDFVRELKWAQPPIDEQNSIVEFLLRETNKLDKIIIQAEETIALMHERRASLISEAVTGKIDVRELA